MLELLTNDTKLMIIKSIIGFINVHTHFIWLALFFVQNFTHCERYDGRAEMLLMARMTYSMRDFRAAVLWKNDFVYFTYQKIHSWSKVDTLTYFSSAAIVFAFKTCQIFAIGAFVIWSTFEHIIGTFFHAFETIFCCIINFVGWELFFFPWFMSSAAPR